jgi:hypothetical protein
MNQQPQSPTILVLQHVQRPCASLDSVCFDNPHFHLYSALWSNSSLHPLTLQMSRPAAHSNFANHRDLLNHIQNP